jgi:Eisosome component PIL1
MPAPPPSSTKGHRFFASNLGLSFRKNAAGAFAPELAKRLTQLVKMEKSLMRSIELV